MGITTTKKPYIVPFLFGFSLLFGQVVRIPFFGGTLFVHDIVLFLLAFSSSCMFMFTKRKPGKKELIEPFSFFTVALLLSVGWHFLKTRDQGSVLGLLYVFRYIFYFFAYLMVFRISKPIYWLISLFFFGSTVSVLGLVQYVLYPDLRNLMYLGWDPHYGRLFSVFFDPNFAGIVITLTLFLGVFVFLRSKQKIFLGILQVVNMLALTFTFSRSSVLAFAAGAVTLFFLFRKKIALVFLGCFFLLVFFIPVPFGGYFSPMRITSAEARLENWDVSFEMIKTSPVVGHGFYLLEDQKGVDVYEQESGIPVLARGVLDNSLLFVFASAGMVGVFSFVYLLFRMGKLGLILRKKERTRILGSVIIASLVAVCTHSQFVNSFFYPWVLVWLWILLAAGEKQLWDL